MPTACPTALQPAPAIFDAPAQERTAHSVAEQLTALIVRTDSAGAVPSTPLPDGSPLNVMRQLTLSVWCDAAPDTDVLDTMTGVLDRFLAEVHANGKVELGSARHEAIAFIDQAPPGSPTWHLRKNTVMAAYSALRGLGAYHGLAPVAGLRPVITVGSKDKEEPKGKKDKSKKNSKKRKQGKAPKKGKAGRGKANPSTPAPRNRVATSDEVLLARVCARLDCTGALNRRAAALAIACAGAATGEGAQACWTHHTPGETGAPAQLELAGRHPHNPASGWHIKRRTATLDPWSARALDDWRAEASSQDRPLAQEWSIVYDGAKALTHQSAKNSYDHHINLTLDASDLSWIPGLTAMSIGEWAAAHTALRHPHGLSAAATVMGVDPLNCLRRLTKASTRAYKPL